MDGWRGTDLFIYTPSAYTIIVTSTLMMEAVCLSETLATQSTSTQCQHPKAESTFPLNHCESLQSVITEGI
jgi:hypothetical protein